MSELKVRKSEPTPVFDRAVRIVWPDARWGWTHIFDVISGDKIDNCMTMDIKVEYGSRVTIEATLVDPTKVIEELRDDGESYKHFYTYTEMWYLDEIVKE